MALIIKGDMPACCGSCDASGTGACKVWMYHRKHLSEGIPSDCPIIGEIPNSHGRLGDLDALLRKVEAIDCFGDPDKTIDRIIQAIENAPTIIEATE